MTTHAITISHEGPSHRSGPDLVGSSRPSGFSFGGGHRASCSCGWGSDCYTQISDTQRAIDVHLRRSKRQDFDALIARSSIGAAIADVKARGIDAHLVDLEREMTPHRARKAKRVAKKRVVQR